MSGGRILSDAQLIEMGELRERGWSAPRIAAHFTAAGTPVSSGCIDWQCLRVGADVPIRLRGPSPTNPAPYVRRSGPVRPFTAEEDAQLLALEATGAALNAIARQLGRKNNSIRGRLLTLARRDARSEDIA